jgi:hypothetical protein
LQFLGYMVWWRVGRPARQASEVAAAVNGLGVAMPSTPIPVDVFRRLSSVAESYELEDGQTVVLDLHRATSQKTMLTRHIVRTVRKEGVVTAADRVGEAAFYRPPRGQHDRARMRVTVYPEQLPDRERIEAFAEDLREEYKRQLDALDPQAVRRMVRAYLTSVDAVYMNGPYFVPNHDDVERLKELLAVVGGGSTTMTIPVVDDEPRRQMIAEARADRIDQEEAADGTEE